MAQTSALGRDAAHEAALRDHLHRLGPEPDAVQATLAGLSLDGADPEANVRAYLARQGWRGVALEALGDTGWLYVAATAADDSRVTTDLPEPVLAYVNAREGYFDPELTAGGRPGGGA